MKLKKKEQHSFLKLAEELSELSTELLKAVNKPWKLNMGEIQDEIIDVLERIDDVKEILDNG